MIDKTIEGLRTALYIRVSTEEQALHGYSLDAQKSDLVDYAKKHRLNVFDQYVDEGATARKAIKNRKNFMRLIDDVESNKIDLIIFIKLDRWFRNVQDYYSIQSILDDHNVAWKTTQENYDTTTASGRLNLNIRLSIAQDESDRTSERIKFVFENKKKNGEVVSGSSPLGYKIENKHYVIDPDTAPIAKEIFEHYQRNGSKHATLVHITNKFDINISYRTIDRILKNTIYKGEKYDIKGFAPAIISDDLFDRTYASASQNVQKPRTNRVFLFSGLCRCPVCGSRLHGQSSRYKNSEYLIYRCDRHYLDNCCSNNKTISQKNIEKYLLSNIKPLMADYITSFDVSGKKEATILSDTSKIKNRLKKIKELYVNDFIDIDEYKRDRSEYIAQLEAIVPKKKHPNNLPAAKKFLDLDLDNLYVSMSQDEKKALWRSVVREIKAFGDSEFHITFL